MDGTVTFQLVVIVALSVTTAIGIVLWVTSRFGKLWDSLADFKLTVAENYMSKASGSAAIERAVAEIKGLRDDLREQSVALRSDLKDQVNALGDRIERMEDHMLGGRPSSQRAS
jgi:hypothetical protein